MSLKQPNYYRSRLSRIQPRHRIQAQAEIRRVPPRQSTKDNKEVYIVFGKSDGIASGKLRCVVKTNDKHNNNGSSTIHLPEKLLPERMISSAVQSSKAAATHDEHANNYHFSLRQAQAPSAKSRMPTAAKKSKQRTNNNELDLPTLNIILLTMKADLLVSDARSGQQFLFRPKSSTSATLTLRSSAPRPGVEKSSSKETSAATTTANYSGKAVSEHTTDSQSETIVPAVAAKTTKGKEGDNGNYWLSQVKDREVPTDPKALSDFYHSCIDKNEPTPKTFVAEFLPRALWKGSSPEKCEVHLQRLSNIVVGDDENVRLFKSHSSISKQVQKTDRETEESVEALSRMIQVQVMMRLQLYAMAGESFLDLHTKLLSKKVKKKRKRKQLIAEKGVDSPLWGRLSAEISDILSTFAFLLPSGVTLSSFLEGSIPKYIHQSIPDMVQDIFDFFEIPNPYLKPDDENARDEDDDEVHVPVVSDTKKAKSESSPGKAGSGLPDGGFDFHPADNEASPQSEKSKQNTAIFEDDHSTLIRKSFQLTANVSSHNSLLQGGKQKYVGSHFNTNAMSRLVREVPGVRASAATKRVKKSPERKSSSPLSSAKSQSSSSTMRAASTRAVPTEKHQCGTGQSNNNKVVAETPMKSTLLPEWKKLLPKNSTAAAATNFPMQSKAIPNNNKTSIVVTETPMKTSFVTETPIKKKTTKITSLGGTAIAETPVRNTRALQKLSFFDSPMPSSQSQSAHIVAQAALAARKKR